MRISTIEEQIFTALWHAVFFSVSSLILTQLRYFQYVIQFYVNSLVCLEVYFFGMFHRYLSVYVLFDSPILSTLLYVDENIAFLHLIPHTFKSSVSSASFDHWVLHISEYC